MQRIIKVPALSVGESMRIALIHTPLKAPTGGERQLLRLAIELQKRGHEVEIFTNGVDYEKCFPELLSNLNITVVLYPIHIPFGIYYNLFFGMMKIGREVSKGDFDIVNNHNFPSEWAVYFVKRKKYIPSVWMCNEPPFWFFRGEVRKGISKFNWPLFEIFDKLSVNSIDRIVVLSRLMGETVKKIYGRDFTVVRSGIDVKDFEGISGRKFREKYDLEDDFILLQVGTLTHYKRQEDNIKALAILSKKYSNIRLVFIGLENKKYKEKLLNLIKDYKLEDKVLFLGSVPDKVLKQAYAASDVFLFPASQSWSLVTVEAMASRKPVIVSNMCGVSEIIKNGVNGFVINHGDYKMMSKYIELLINDRSLKERIGRNAYKFVKKNLSWEKYAETMEKIFKEVVK